VLGLERDADDDAIKKAYRKQALLWHPGARVCAAARCGHVGQPGRACCRASLLLQHSVSQPGCTPFTHSAERT
jgi:hypothetical protein